MNSVPVGILTVKTLVFVMIVIAQTVLIPLYGSTRQTRNIKHEQSKRGFCRVLYDSPRIADDDRRERLNMKKYGIWKITLLIVSGEVIKCEITARSGKDAKRRVESAYEGCEVLQMFRKTWLDRFSYAELSAALMKCVPDYAYSLLTILADNGVFSGQDEAPAHVD